MSKSDIPARRAVAMVLRYGLAVLSVGVALAITLLLRPDVLVAPVFFLAIILSAWFGGIGPGLFAALLSTLDIAYFFLPRCGQITNLRLGPSQDCVSSRSAPISTICMR
jgi:K+-sensing histidine kinase KdpD